MDENGIGGDSTKAYASKPSNNNDDDDDEDEITAIKNATGKRSLEAFIEERFASSNKRANYGADANQLMPFINIDDETTATAGSLENATTTEGILPLLHILELPNMRTCGRSRENGTLPAQLQVLHVQQKDKWSCGYRNLQILLSALVPQLQHDHPYYKNLPASLKRSDIGVAVPIPSLTQLQTFLERAWMEGFDPKGAEYYQGKILGKKSKIGAIEVSSLLSWLSLDSVVVQFIKTKDSRSLLGPFVWAYFCKKGCPCYNCSRVSYNPSTCLTTGEILLREAVNDHTDVETTCNHPLLPLYLQWEGHSVTIIGVQRKPKSDGSGFDYDLLVFDPMKDGDSLHKTLSRAFELESTSKAVGPLLLPSSQFLEKDVQIVIASVRPLPPAERERFRQKINSVTASRRSTQQFGGKVGSSNSNTTTAATE